MKNFLIIAAAILMPFMASAQFSISGKITDKQSGQPLGRAGIYLDNSFVLTQSDLSGNYFLKNLKAGKYAIRITYLGYKSFELQDQF